MQLKPDYYYEQSAAIPVIRDDEGLHIVLITTRKRRRWIVPKGIVEPGWSPMESACKEAREEAGVTGTGLGESMGSYTYEKWGGICSVQVFVLLVGECMDHWEEDMDRDRCLLPIERAAERVDEPDLRDMILRLPAFLAARAGPV
jgi:8-oxo-dGTP pyrophosphatase MutT (NUDIX family)